MGKREKERFEWVPGEKVGMGLESGWGDEETGTGAWETMVSAAMWT